MEIAQGPKIEAHGNDMVCDMFFKIPFKEHHTYASISSIQLLAILKSSLHVT